MQPQAVISAGTEAKVRFCCLFYRGNLSVCGLCPRSEKPRAFQLVASACQKHFCQAGGRGVSSRWASRLKFQFQAWQFRLFEATEPAGLCVSGTLSNFCPGNGISRRKSRPVPDDCALEDDEATSDLPSSRALLRGFDSLKPRTLRFVAFVFLE